MKSQQTNEKADGSNYKILVVDDSRLLMNFLEKWLRKCRFSLVAVSSGREAIDRFNKEWFDLVLTDIFMPGINGNRLAPI